MKQLLLIKKINMLYALSIIINLFATNLFSAKANNIALPTHVASPLAVANDNFASATDVTALINAACTSGGVYTNVTATADQLKGSCWSGGPYSNVWFKFTASATGFINVQVKVNGAGQTMRYPMVALWSNASTQLQCQNQQGYGNGASNLSVSYIGLTPGTEYYISVDDYGAWGNTGKFDLCLSDVPDYDYPQGAVDLTSSINAACATSGVYSNQYATADNAKGSCWSGGPYQNRWFKFTASATGFINMQVKVSGASETMRYPMVALWDASLATQLQCQNQQGYGNGAMNLSVSYYGLTPGATYYIEVDDYAAWGNSGKFDICLSDVVDYDYPQGAVDLTSSINVACATSGVYSNQYATADNAKGSCWSGGPYQNRWFKFTATSTTFINVQVKVSSASQTLRYPMVALWNASLSSQLQCQNQQGYGNGASNLSVSYYGLTPGATYYIEVDDYAAWGNSGKFDICLSDVVDYDYPQGAVDVTSDLNGGCTSGGAYSNQYATADNAKGTCWSGGPYRNRWFKFTATSTTFINAQVKVSGAGETMRYPMVALWDASLATQLQCQNQQGYGNGASDLSMSYYGLTPGATYYIAVDYYASWGNSGTFDLCVSDQPDYDYPQGAVDLDPMMNGCSTGGTYSNQYATADNAKGTCWSGGPYQNRWFKFTATSSTFINAQVKVSGVGETMRYPMVALWNSSLTTQLQCQNQQGYGNGANDLSMSYYGLTPGATYYIAVDYYASWGNSGTFDLCVSDQPDYDYPEGAVVLTNVNNFCSTGGLYSNTTATADHTKGSCWSGGPYRNRWFKFQALTSTVTATVGVSGSGETMRYPMMALWQSNFSSQLACTNQAGYGNGANNITLNYTGLTIGNWYYISVDYYASWGNPGSFDICINNASTVQYYSIGTGDWSNSANWSTTSFAGSTAGTIPSLGNIVHIKDQSITVSSTQSCNQINMTVSGANTSLTIDNASLTVNGTYNQTNSGSNNDMVTTVQNNGTLVVNNNANFNRNGGANAFQFNVGSGSNVIVGQDIIWTSSAGTTQTSQMNSSGTMTIGRDLILNSTGGMLIHHTFSNNSILSVGRDVTFTATAAGKTQITLNNNSTLNLARNFVRSATPYGILSMASTASITLNGSGAGHTQNIVGNAGAGGDQLNYTNVIINNTSGNTPSVFVTGPVTITGALTLTKGIVQTTSTNSLVLSSTASSSSGSINSFISGPLTKIGNTPFVFPIGKSSKWARLGITAPSIATNQLTAEYFKTQYTNTISVNAPLTNVSTKEYWTLSESTTGDPVQVSLYWESATFSGIQTFDNTLRVAHWNGTKWDDIGQASISGGSTGYVTSSLIGSFSPFTFGSYSKTLNPLPIELVSFTATPNGNKVDVNWQTATETNNQYFTVERSDDAVNFEPLKVVNGAGNSLSTLNYYIQDESPLSGMSYYRLKQTDFNGNSKYSTISSVVFAKENTYALAIFPNPTSETNVNVILTSLKSVEVIFSIKDISGKELYSTSVVTKNSGNNEYTMDPNFKLAAGIYFMTASSSEGVITKKLIIK